MEGIAFFLAFFNRMSPTPALYVMLAAQESYLSGTSGSYVEDMYESWCYDPKSVHASWDAYFRGGAYQVQLAMQP